MAAGSGTVSYPTLASEGTFTEAAGGLLSIAVDLFAGSAIKQLDQAVKRLYQGADDLAIKFTEFVIAELWWAAHLGTATSELAGYLDEAAGHVQQMADDELAAWREFLEVKYPADLRDLYNRLEARIPTIHKVNLQGIEAAIRKLQADDLKEQAWQKHTATPKLTQWTAFYAEWRTTYAPPLRTLRAWLKNPGQLAQFAGPALVAWLPSGLRQRASQQSAQSIEAVLVSTWNNQAQVIWTQVQLWLTAEL